MPNHFPKFAHTQNPNLHVGQEIFIIDENKYDIYRAEIVAIKDGVYTIFYPDYETTEEINGIDRILLKNNVNKKIFKEQELIRSKIEADTAQVKSESDGESDEDEEKKPVYRPPKTINRVKIPQDDTILQPPPEPEPPKPAPDQSKSLEVTPNITIPVTFSTEDSKVLFNTPQNIEISTSKSSDTNEVTFSFKITFKK